MTPRSTRKSAAMIFKEGIFLLFVFVMGFLISVSLFAPEALLKLFGFMPYVVQSNSMKPVFELGDIIIITKANTNNLQENDIIAVKSRRQIKISHFLADQYIDSENHLRFKTKPYGSEDQSDWDYESLRRDQIIGRVSLIIPKLGHITLFLRSPIGIITVILAAILIYLLIRNNNKMKEEQAAQRVLEDTEAADKDSKDSSEEI